MNERKQWPVRVGLAVVVAIYVAYSLFGIDAPFWWGHHGYHGATYMLRVRMTLRLHMLSPATWGGSETPPLAALYFHHPIGYHHLLELFILVFGDHEWVVRAVAAAGGLLALFALYKLVARHWSRELGLVAVTVYVFLPVLASFSVLSDPMLPAMACVLWSLDVYLQLLDKPQRKQLWQAFWAYALGGAIMWEAYFIGPFIALHALGYFFFVARGKTLRIELWGRRWPALPLHVLVTGVACVIMMGLHIWLTYRSGAWNDFLDSYRLRHNPPSAQYVINRHVLWVSILYGATPVVFGAAWFVLWLARLATGRGRRRDLAILTFLYINTLYIYMFAEGSSVHLYRVFFYSSFFTLAVTDLAGDVYRGARRLWRTPTAAVAASLALVAGYLVCEVPHWWHNLIESRELMGTHGEPHYSPEQQKLRFAAEVHARTDAQSRVIIHYPELGARKEFWYYIDRNYDEIQNLAELSRLQKTQPRSVLILDDHMMSPPDRQIFAQLIAHHPVTFFENFIMVDLRSNTPGAQSYAFVPQPMSTAYRYFVSHKYPPLALVKRTYLPGECAAWNAGAPVASDEELPPLDEPRHLACYRDLLAARHAPASATAPLDAQLSGGLPTTNLALGSAHIVASGLRGPQLTLVYRGGGPERGQLRYLLHAPTPPAPNAPPPKDTILGPSPDLPPPDRWLAGHTYNDHVLLPPGTWQVETQLVTPKPGADVDVLAHASLGTLTR